MEIKRKLPKEKLKNRCYYVLVKRTKQTAMYAQHYCTCSRIIGYEVFRVVTLPKKVLSSEMTGTVELEIESREKFPSNEDFGKIAWTFKTRKEAEMKFQEMERSVDKQRNKHVINRFQG